jgi:ATP-dependent RNA helicase DHX40
MMPMHTVPEIQRSSLAAVVLTLKCLGVEDVLNFDYLDPPEEFHLLEALRRLYFFDALDRAGNVTLVGRLMSNFPLSPSLARVLLTALETNMPERYAADLVGVVAMLSCEEPYIRPRELDALIGLLHQ